VEDDDDAVTVDGQTEVRTGLRLCRRSGRNPIPKFADMPMPALAALPFLSELPTSVTCYDAQ
jgi:hypothetical protein